MSDPELTVSLRVLDERGIDVDRSSIAPSFASYGASQGEKDARAWVRQHLTDDSLLTKEELYLYGPPP